MAPMPGVVVRVGAALGEHVTAGQPLVWLEAMKMEHTIAAPTDGVLTQLNVTAGEQVGGERGARRIENSAGTAAGSTTEGEQ